MVFRRKRLVCFYCGSKSDIHYNGQITQWECMTCEANNYLDANGDITDPPVSTFEVAPPNLAYHPPNQEQIPFMQDAFNKTSKALKFCDTCIKNQHLYTSSLAQYHVILDTSHPQYQAAQQELRVFRLDLEKRYPQCCEDCHPMVKAALTASARTAKNDWFRKGMARSRAKRLVNISRSFTIGDLVALIGRCLWLAGILLQLLWNGFVIGTLTDFQSSTNLKSESALNTAILYWRHSRLAQIVLGYASYLPNGNMLGFWGLVLSACSFWWSPMFKESNRGFVRQVSGFGDWYKHQLMVFVLRFIFYNVFKTESFAYRLPAFTQGFHLFFACFVLALAFRSVHFIKVDMNQLWGEIPDRLDVIGPSGRDSRPMKEILEQYGVPSNAPSTHPIKPDRPYYVPPPYVRGSIRVDRNGPIEPTNLLKDNLESTNVRRRLIPGSDVRNTSINFSEAGPSQDQHQHSYDDSMDWQPTSGRQPSPPKSQHRAFSHNLPDDKGSFFGQTPSAQLSTKLFGQSPLAPEHGAFWAKIPAAPTTPAQRARNPTSQPAFKAATDSKKQGFFGSSGPSSSTWQSSDSSGVDFAPQKFIVPSQEIPELEQFMSSFTVGGRREAAGPQSEAPGAKFGWQRLAQGLSLLVAVIIGYHLSFGSTGLKGWE